MSWTNDRVALLKKLWGEGKTAAEIAHELGGVSRNAVIGKAHRLKLSGRISPIQQNKKPPAKLPEKKTPPAPPTRQEINRKTIPLTALGAQMCRWPIGDPQEKGFGFCGDTSMTGLPYCRDHAKMAYQAATRNRIIKAEQDGQKHPGAGAAKAGKKQEKMAV